jgi:hypothetical protein
LNPYYSNDTYYHVFFNNEEEKEDVGDKEEKLKSAAKDALAAFLVGGSDNLSFASTAEEVARESCRVGAKAIFTERIRGKLKSHCDICNYHF